MEPPVVQFQTRLAAFRIELVMPTPDLLRRICNFLLENENLLNQDRKLQMSVGSLHHEIVPVYESTEEVNALLEKIEAVAGYMVVSPANANKAITFLREHLPKDFLDANLTKNPSPVKQLAAFRDTIDSELCLFHPNFYSGATLKKEVLLENAKLLRGLTFIQTLDSGFKTRLSATGTEAEFTSILEEGQKLLALNFPNHA